MNKAAIKKSVGQHVTIWPPAKRFLNGPNGFPLPPVDADDWRIAWAEDARIALDNIHTHHGVTLGFDHIKEYMTDSVRGKGYGKLILKAQVNIGGCHAWTVPIVHSCPVPDQFQNVRGWKRENDAAYIQSQFPAAHAARVIPQATNGSRALGFGLLACLCVGLLIANT